MELGEALEVTKIYSVSGLLPSDTPLIRLRPFCAPHHTISQAGLVGGGSKIRPGEITRAHRGVLFLDELPEFGQQTLDVLRQPLEDRIVTTKRMQYTTAEVECTVGHRANRAACRFVTLSFGTRG